MKTILKLLEGIQSNYWGDISSLSPRVSAFLVTASAATRTLFLRGQCLFLGGAKIFGLVYFSPSSLLISEKKGHLPIWSNFVRVLC